jgi:hypothetical protein
MGCCGNNPNCKKTASANFETTTAPVENLMDFKDIVNLLGAMARTGVKNFAFKDASLDQLALVITQLASENNYLKRLATLISPAGVDLSGDDVVFSFGPANVYSLTMPAGNEEQRKILGAQFLKIAGQLGVTATEDTKQLSLF